jgi:general secretion pathway protein A
VARAQENPAELNCLDYFGLTRPPFARLSDPSEIYDVEQYSLLMSYLDRAAQATDHLVVLRGADGSGKTTLLNRYVAGLSDETYFATVDETCSNETDFYCSFLHQLGFNDITGKPGELRRITTEFLVHRAKAGDTVLLIIDNAHHVSPSVLEQLRRIAETTVDERRVISAVITGNSHIRRIIESPAMQQLKFRDVVDFHIRVYSETETAEYVRHRLSMAGGSDAEILAADAYPMIHRFTGGIPGQINRLCEVLLVDAVERKQHPITGEAVRSVAESEQLPPYVIPMNDQGRRKTDTGPAADANEVRITARVAPADKPGETAPSAPVYGPSVDVDELLARLARVSEQIDRLKSDKSEAQKDIAERDQTIAELSEKLGTRSDEARTLAKTVRESADETGRLKLELVEHDKSTKKLAAELKSEQRAAKAARKEAEKAEQRIGKLESLQSELHATVADLRKELESAIERAKRVDDLEEQLEASREECSRLQSESEAFTELKTDIATKDAQIASLTAEIAAQSVDLTSTLTILSEQLPESDDAVPVLQPEEELPAGGIGRFDVIRDGKVERTIAITEMPARCMIGRDEDCDLCLDSKYVSRHHALLLCTPTKISVEDLNSFNGTKVNFNDVSNQELRPDDVIIIGDFLIRARRGG